EGGADLTTGIGFTLPARQLLRGRGEKPDGQKLLMARVKGRPAVIFSEFDLVAASAGIANYKALSYKPESARKILGNLVTYLTVGWAGVRARPWRAATVRSASGRSLTVAARLRPTCERGGGPR